MNKYFISLMACLFVSTSTKLESISGNIESNIGLLFYSISVPSGHTTIIWDTPIDLCDKDVWILIKYRDRSLFYICNCGNSTPNSRNYPQGYEWGFTYPITNNDMLSFGTGYPTGTYIEDTGTFAMAEDSICLSGYTLRSKCWKEIQYKDVCIGYTNVPKKKKELFDDCLSTFKIHSIEKAGNQAT